LLFCNNFFLKKKVDKSVKIVHNIHILRKEGTLVMKFDKDVCEVFNKAITSPTNLLEDGTINWNFVHADLYLDMSARGYDVLDRKQSEQLDEKFDNLADAFLGELA